MDSSEPLLRKVEPNTACTSSAVFAVFVLVTLTNPHAAFGSLARNAAGARNMGESGTYVLDSAVQFEKGDEERAWAAELGLQIQLTDRFQLLVEAVPFLSEDPDGESAVRGLGDTELTASFLVLPDDEETYAPSLVLGAKAKLPTAGSDLGTGKPDYSGLLILGKEFELLDLEAEFEYATFGSPSGVSLDDQFLYSLSADYSVSDLLSVFAEVSGNSAPTADESRSDVGTFGFELDVAQTESATTYVTLEFDTESTATARVGFELAW
ncbi:MAG: transporter [Candidatus Eisenbacteria bacterium]